MAVKASATITLSFMVDVSAVYRYYKLQASTASVPSVPTAFPPTGWDDVEPNYTSGSTQTLYTVDCTVFTNSTFLYSAVSKSSSYEAAKEAYNKALAAENSVNNIVQGKPLFTTSGTDGAGGYVEVITINYNSANQYLNKPITFRISQRWVETYTLTFSWSSTNGVPSIAMLTTDRNSTSALAVKWSDYMCSIYIRKSEEWDSISVMEVKNPYTNGEVTVQLYSDNTSYVGSDLISWSAYGYLYSVLDQECATNYITHLEGSLMVSDMTDPTRHLYGGSSWSSLSDLTWDDLSGMTWDAFSVGKNVLIDSDGVKIRDNTTALASFGTTAIEFEEPVTFKSPNLLVNNGDTNTYLGRNIILWSGAYHMNQSQTISLNATIYQQLSGIVLAWSHFDTSTQTADNYDWSYFIVPKHHSNYFSGENVRMANAYLGLNKLLYVSNGSITGHAQNGTSGTTNGIAWSNGDYVLRYVLGI